MNPTLSRVSEEGEVLRFTLSGLALPFANAIRRTILSDVPINVIHTETYAENQCQISVNTSRLHNEILKQRLSCIPIHIKELDLLPGKYQLEVDVTNETDHTIYVTTEDFRIKNKETGNYLTRAETQRIFPPSANNYYIDFARLRPKMGDSIPAEQLKLVADFSTHTAKKNNMYNVVSKCSYAYTPDAAKAATVWDDHESKLRSDGATKEDIEFQKRNFYLLDAQRVFIPNSYDFVLQTLGIYDNKELVTMACAILQRKMAAVIEAVDSDTLPIHISETTIESCYDIVLEDEDYTVGKVLEYLLYDKYYVKEHTLSFCGFKKFHPHNMDSVLRVAFSQPGDKALVRQYLRTACVEAADLFGRIQKMF
jgi:DNA-directed RNA polymerase alpha subunit/DNA-directed RNA polymerase subunit L